MAKDFFTADQRNTIVEAVKQAERRTSGEIRVHIEAHCRTEVLDRAASVFDMLGMQHTVHRSGVLFYLALKDHKFAILGDAGINAKTGEGFWDEIRLVMEHEFRAGRFTEGLTTGIGMAGEKLSAFFPLKEGDSNELGDEISFGK